MTSIDTAAPDLAAVKQRQQAAWASGDFAVVAARIVLVAEHLCDTADLQAGWRVLDVATGSGNAAIAAARHGCDGGRRRLRPALLDARPASRRRGGPRGRLRGGRRRGAALRRTAPSTPSRPSSARCSRPTTRRRPPSCSASAGPAGTIALASWTPDGFIGELFRTVAAARAAAGRRAVADALGHRGAPARRSSATGSARWRSRSGRSRSGSARPRSSSTSSAPGTGRR